MVNRIFCCSKCSSKVVDDGKIVISTKVTDKGVEEYCKDCTTEIRYPGLKSYVESVIDRAINKQPLTRKELDLLKKAINDVNKEKPN